MKIFHITPSYPPYLGGMEKVVQILANTQAELGLKIAVITSDQHADISKDQTDLNVVRLRSYRLANTIIIPSLLPRLLSIKRRDIVHLHTASAYAPEIVWLASRLKGFRYIAHIHLNAPPSGPAGFLLKIYQPLILRRVLKAANFVVVFTEDQKLEIHKKYGVSYAKIKAIPNGVERQFYNDKSRVLHKKPRLLFVGRLSLQKNLSYFLQSLQGISDQFETVLVGEGDLEHELKKQAQKLNLRNVNFVGRADGEKLLNYYKRADIFVLPSEREGMPLVLLEAMAMGLPIIATDVTGSRDVVKSSKNGFLVPYEDVKELRSVLIKIGSNGKLYKELSQTSLKMSRHYSWEKVAAQFSALYEAAYE